MGFLRFGLSENVFVSHLFLKEHFVMCRIRGCEVFGVFFFFYLLKDNYSGLHTSDEMTKSLSLLFCVCLFPHSGYIHDFHLSLVFSGLNIICLFSIGIFPILESVNLLDLIIISCYL